MRKSFAGGFMYCIQTGIFGVNTWLIPLEKNGVLVVDPDFSEVTNDAEPFIELMEDKGFVPVGIFLTHGHFDHIAGTGILKKKYPFAKLCVHKNDASMIGRSALLSQGRVLDYMGIPEFKNALENLPDADIFSEDSEKLSSVFDTDSLMNDERFSKNFSGSPEKLKDALSAWKIIFTPGHTEGSVCIYNENEKKLVSGDTMFYHSYGRTDLPGGSDEKMQKSLRLIKKIVSRDALVYPGHDKSGFLFGENDLLYE